MGCLTKKLIIFRFLKRKLPEVPDGKLCTATYLLK
jgi:hypothetical protein